MGDGTQTTHGTQRCYQGGCRRPECKKAWADYIRQRRHRLGEQTPRDQRRFFPGPYGQHGFDALTEHILEAAARRTGWSWRDVVGLLVRRHGTTAEFPAASETAVN